MQYFAGCDEFGRIVHTFEIVDGSLLSGLYIEVSAETWDAFNLSDCAYAHKNLYFKSLVHTAPTLRPTMWCSLGRTTISANAQDAITLSNLPDSCTITYSGPGFLLTREATCDTASFTTDVAGTHTVKVVAFPYLDWEGTFDAV